MLINPETTLHAISYIVGTVLIISGIIPVLGYFLNKDTRNYLNFGFILGVFIIIFGIILIPSWIQLFYTFNKSGMVWSIREGFSIYAFANISKINEVNSFWHHVAEVRTLRVLYLKK